MKLPQRKGLHDITKQKFGRLRVKEYAGVLKTYANGQNIHGWLCKCKCGNMKVIAGGSLRSGNTTSCGCYQKKRVRDRMKDLTRHKFGRLLVIGYAYTRKKQTYWHCKCKCGNKKVVCGVNLRFKKTKSCGCRQGRFTHGMWGKPGYKALYLSDPVKKMRHIVSCAVKDALQERGGRKGGRTFDHLSYTPKQLKEHLESLWEPWMSWENYGGRNNDKRKTWQIDHIRPQVDFPYISLDDPLFQECWNLSNLRPMEKIANIKKGNK